jgi:hypothetical protein
MTTTPAPKFDLDSWALQGTCPCEKCYRLATGRKEGFNKAREVLLAEVLEQFENDVDASFTYDELKEAIAKLEAK